MFVAVSYNKAYDDTIQEYEPYDFVEFASSTQSLGMHRKSKTCIPVYNELHILQRCK